MASESKLTDAPLAISIRPCASASGLGCANLRQRFLRGADYCFRANVEFLVDVGNLPGGAEGMHSEGGALEADAALPSELNGGLPG
jgi:hypothetical protein